MACLQLFRYFVLSLMKCGITAPILTRKASLLTTSFSGLIGQLLLAEVCRRMLNLNIESGRSFDAAAVSTALEGLSNVSWWLHRPPWRYFLLTGGAAPGQWRMRSEDRTEALKVARRILEWMLGIDDLPTEDIEDMKLDWQTRLIPAQTVESQDAMWNEIVAKRQEITSRSG